MNKNVTGYAVRIRDGLPYIDEKVFMDTTQKTLWSNTSISKDGKKILYNTIFSDGVERLVYHINEKDAKKEMRKILNILKNEYKKKLENIEDRFASISDKRIFIHTK